MWAQVSHQIKNFLTENFFFLQKILSQNFEKFLALLRAFSCFLPYLAIYLCSPDDVLPVHMRPKTNSTFTYVPKNVGPKNSTQSVKLKNEITRDMSSQPPVAVWPKNVPKVLKNKITEAILIVRFNSRFD